MGIKRIVDTEIWTDDKVESFTPEEKYFWVYLLTNPFTKQLGIYKITKKQMSFQLGYDIETITKLLDRFENEHKVIKYIENEVAIKNYLKHSIMKGGKPVEDCLLADIRAVKHKSLIKWVFGSLKTDDVNETVKGVVEYWLGQEKESTKEKEYINDNDNDNDNDSIVTTIRQRIVDESSKESIYKIPLNIKNTYYSVTQEEIDFYKQIYPNVDVEQEYRNMIGWCDANPKRLKTKDGVKRFINTWLSKEQDRGGSITKEERETKLETQKAYIKDVELRQKQQEQKGDTIFYDTN